MSSRTKTTVKLAASMAVTMALAMALLSASSSSSSSFFVDAFAFTTTTTTPSSSTSTSSLRRQQQSRPQQILSHHYSRRQSSSSPSPSSSLAMSSSSSSSFTLPEGMIKQTTEQPPVGTQPTKPNLGDIVTVKYTCYGVDDEKPFAKSTKQKMVRSVLCCCVLRLHCNLRPSTLTVQCSATRKAEEPRPFSLVYISSLSFCRPLPVSHPYILWVFSL
mmetsp:Transcript_1934/g.4453  ORF Transcript_1934/g.4453 Transcript_1934/m.4453 type:complete len:217 (-) Transcript_1934:896-1546(-)